MAADQADRDDEAPRTPDTPAEQPSAERDAAPATEPADAGAAHETREQPLVSEAGQTRDSAPSDPWAETAIRPVPTELGGTDRSGPGSTSVLPPVDDAPATPRWSARASVRTPDVVEEEHDWAEPPRGLIVPVLVAVCILLLIGLLGLATWLIFAQRPSSQTPAATPTVQNATPPVTTQGPTSTTTPPPTPVALPDVRGLSYDEAATRLTQLGFTPVRRDEIDLEVEKGKVVGTDPPVGTPVVPGPGVRINVIVSLGVPETTPPEPTESPSPQPT